MKSITNFKNATVFDLEANGLLEEGTKIHVLSFKMKGKETKSIKGDNWERIEAFFKYHLDNGIPLVAHNGISYDIKFVEKILGIDLSGVMLIDTLALSWYLNPHRNVHGLDSFHEDYGVKKPPIDDWENLPYEVYQNRCEVDVEINSLLWEDLQCRLSALYLLAKVEIDAGSVGGKRMSDDEVIAIDRLVGLSVDEHICRILSFLMFKMDCAALQETTGWDVDLEKINQDLAVLQGLQEESREQLESVMPKIPKYTTRKAPVKPFTMSGEKSATGKRWDELLIKINTKEVDEFGTPLAKWKEGKIGEEAWSLSEYEPPNANSPAQIKSFLFSMGWVPQTFKYEKDEEAMNKWVASKPAKGAPRSAWDVWKANKPKDREIPQITKQTDEGKVLCHSLEELAEEVPQIKLYSVYCVIKHRIGILKGFLRDEVNGKVKAGISGFTNTLRVQHREVVNLPGTDKLYGEMVRGSLVAPKGKVLAGSDLSSLEDRVKHHFMLPYDPDYVETMMAPDYDPHIDTALFSKMITQEEYKLFKSGEKTPKIVKARKAGKATNYASVYNAGPSTIARAAGVSEEEGIQLHKGYWELNWSVKAIAEEQVVVEDSRGGKWLVNPINGFCYSLRKDSDRFSTLCQGTGSYFFDMWVDNILEEQQQRFKKKTLTGSFHDENIFCIADQDKWKMLFVEMIQDGIKKVNTDFMLRRELGCETQFGYKYSDIH